MARNADGTDIDLESRADFHGLEGKDDFIKKGSIHHDSELGIIDPEGDTQA